MKNGFILSLVAIVCIALTSNAWDNHPTQQAPANEQPAALPEWATVIDNSGNAFTGSLTAEQIGELAMAGTEVIIRLNGDSQADRGHLSISEEAEAAEWYGIRFYYFNIDATADIRQEVNKAARIMASGKTVVHCRHGAHRAPAVAAYYLQERWRMPKAQVIEKVGWSRLVRDPGKYARYTSLLR